MIRQVRLSNFKRFRDETFELSPDGLTLIAGGNNSGKSSILQALALWEFCRREMESKHGRGALEAANVGHVFRSAFKDFSPLLIPNFQHLWTNLSTSGRPMGLAVAWTDGQAAGAERELAFELDLPGPLRVKTVASTVPAGAIIPRLAYLPPFAGVTVKEQKMDVAARERLLGKGLPGAVLRNHLCDLESRSRVAYEALRNLRGRVNKGDRSNFLRTDSWKQLVTLLNEEFKCMVYPAESRPRGADGHIDLTANLTKGSFVNGRFAKHKNYKSRDLVSEGSGFLQWLSVFALAVDRDLDVLLLDEADVHLHPTLQGRLLFRLGREAVDKGKQVLYVTHSTEVIREADYRTVFYVAENAKGYLDEESGKVRVLAGLGSLYAPRLEKLQRHKRLLIVEGASDLALLQIWAHTLGAQWPPRLVEWMSTGKPSERKTLVHELKKEVTGLHALSLRDRDDEAAASTSPNLGDGNHPDPVPQPGETWRLRHRKWRRRHIENYLVLPAAIARAAVAKGIACTEQDVVDFLRNQHSVAVNDTFAQSDCSNAIKDMRAKEITYSSPNNTEERFGVNRFDIARAMTVAEICADVKTLVAELAAFSG